MAPMLYICAGHGAGDSGAVGGGYTEAERVRALANAIKHKGGDAVVLLDTSRNWYQDNGIRTYNFPDNAYVVELHMDAVGDTTAHGGHVCIPAGVATDSYMKAVRDFIVEFFPGRSVTIDPRPDLANCNRARARGLDYMLVENGFISNATDRDTFNRSIDDLADAYLAAFGVTNTETPGSSHQTYSLALDGVFEYYTKLAFQEFLRSVGTYGTGLALDGDFGYYSVLAWQEYMRQKGFYGPGLNLDGLWGYYTSLAGQEWLRAEGYYGTGLRLDGVWVYYSTLALQEFLRAKGFYN